MICSQRALEKFRRPPSAQLPAVNDNLHVLPRAISTARKVHARTERESAQRAAGVVARRRFRRRIAERTSSSALLARPARLSRAGVDLAPPRDALPRRCARPLARVRGRCPGRPRPARVPSDEAPRGRGRRGRRRDVGIPAARLRRAPRRAPSGRRRGGHDVTLERARRHRPAFVDAHTHCARRTQPRCRTGSINDALACEVTDQPRWSSPTSARAGHACMDFALRSCLHHGTRAVRTPRRRQRRGRGARPRVRRLRRREPSTRRSHRAPGRRQPLPPALRRPPRDGRQARGRRGEARGRRPVLRRRPPPPPGRGARDAPRAEASADVDLHVDENNNPAGCGVEGLRRGSARGRAGMRHRHPRPRPRLCRCSRPRRARCHRPPAPLAPPPSCATRSPTPPGPRPTRPGVAIAAAPRTPLWRGLTLLQEPAPRA